MILEFESRPDFDFMRAFAERFHVPIRGNRLTIPATLGEGHIRRIELDGEFKITMHRYKLKEEFVLVRKASADNNELATIILHSNAAPISLSTEAQGGRQVSKHSDGAIQIANSGLNSVTRFPPDTDIYFTVIGFQSSRLKELLSFKKQHPLLQAITGGQNFLYYERMDTDVLKVLTQMTDYKEQALLGQLFYRYKVMELLYMLFSKLLQRDEVAHKPVNKADIDKLFVIRTAILADLSVPPVLPELSRMAGLSETKMKDLFRQVFGDSIYNYFQQARMEEAAWQLKQTARSVSEVGYDLGFTNLSHFSRLFERHYGITPKKYASGG